jgi:hypothetical protein
VGSVEQYFEHFLESVRMGNVHVDSDMELSVWRYNQNGEQTSLKYQLESVNNEDQRARIVLNISVEMAKASDNVSLERDLVALRE